MTNHPKPKPEDESPEKKTNNRHVYIEPGAKIDFVKDIKDNFESAQRDDTTHKHDQLVWTKIASGLLLLTAFFAGCQAKIARDTFYIVNRPYIGTNGIEFFFQRTEATVGSTIDPKISKSPTSETSQINIRVPVRNFGPVPATNFKGRMEAFLGNSPLTAEQIAITSSPATVYPTEVDYFKLLIGEPQDYRDIVKGARLLRLRVTLEYDGPSGHTKECQEHQYSAEFNDFAALGKCR